VHAGGSHNHAWQLPYPEHETIGNSTQPVSEQTNGEEHTHVLFVCLREHDGQRRSRQKCRLVDVRRRVWGSGVGRWGHSWVPPRSGVSSHHMWAPCDLHVTCNTISLKAIPFSFQIVHKGCGFPSAVLGHQLLPAVTKRICVGFAILFLLVYILPGQFKKSSESNIFNYAGKRGP
jgi:hypothetical protein